MSSKILLRIAAGCMLFFAVGHSIGHSTRKSSTEPQAQEVLKAMESYKFPIGSQFRSYDEFYEGMSINLIITLLALTILLWIISGFAEAHPKVCSKLGWPLLIAIVGFSVTGFLYFFLVPAITCVVAAICVGVALYKL